MDCFCGCGRRVPRSLTDANLRLGETALDLLAWDRYRTLGHPSPTDLAEVEDLIARGAACHRHLIAAVHGERDHYSMTESDDWLGRSMSAWTTRPMMGDEGALMRRPKLHLTEEDLARLDRVHPDQSFSSLKEERAEEDLVDDLERLGGLRQKGLLTEDEFQAAKAKLLR